MVRPSTGMPRGVVTVFGSSRVRPTDSEYQDARRLGRLLALDGWTLCNGGHEGTMEAAARGAKEAGGATVGVTISLYQPAVPNPWLDREIVTDSLLERLERLVGLADAFVVLRGGIGTLLELVLVWNLAGNPTDRARPVIVVGEHLAAVLDALQDHLPMRTDEVARIVRVASVGEAVTKLAEILDRGLGSD